MPVGTEITEAFAFIDDVGEEGTACHGRGRACCRGDVAGRARYIDLADGGADLAGADAPGHGDGGADGGDAPRRASR